MKYKKLVDLLIQKKFKISFAESLTGGLLCSKIVEIPSASLILDYSVVTYANWAKEKFIQVNNEDIVSKGVVSEEVAKQMACGIRAKANSNIGISTTGIAGPSGGSDTKPVGMVCFGIAFHDKVFTYTKKFGKIGRNKVRNKSVKFVLDTLYKLLKEEN